MLVQVLSLLKSGKIIFKKLSFNKVLQVAENTLTALKKTKLARATISDKGKESINWLPRWPHDETTILAITLLSAKPTCCSIQVFYPI